VAGGLSTIRSGLGWQARGGKPLLALAHARAAVESGRNSISAQHWATKTQCSQGVTSPGKVCSGNHPAGTSESASGRGSSRQRGRWPAEGVAKQQHGHRVARQQHADDQLGIIRGQPKCVACPGIRRTVGIGKAAGEPSKQRRNSQAKHYCAKALIIAKRLGNTEVPKSRTPLTPAQGFGRQERQKPGRASS